MDYKANQGSQALLNTLKSNKPQFRNHYDAVVFVLHLIAKQQGFQCLGSSDVNDEAAINMVVPLNWQQSPDSYTFRYRHPSKPNETFVVKMLVMEGQLIVHGLTVSTKQPCHFDISDVADYVKKSAQLNDYANLYINLETLESLYRMDILNNFVMPSNEAKAASDKQDTGYYGQVNDPLREPPRRQPRMPSYPDEDPYATPFGIGHGDVFPAVPGGPPIGWGPGSGNLIGPGHPGFGPGVRDPFALPRGPQPPGGGRGGLPPSHPPGARFDPFGPPGVNRPDPDKDDPPPNYDNMYL